ncbi:MAG: hypothetical protein K8R91_04855 [Phycisphaerae bacterium]|nr:hypothetical protein [Phycisphaerae bacterium]
MDTQTRPVSQTVTSGTSRLVGTLILFSLAVVIPSLGLPQYITGTAVNALLIIAVETAGVSRALWVGVAPSLVAWGSGILPAPLIVMIPFIVAGNGLLVATFGALRRTSYWLRLVTGAAIKCAWLWVTVTLVAIRPFSIQIGQDTRPVAIPLAMAQMMSWPQLLTALTGGCLAYGLLMGYRAWRKS